jgi:hypothetical protein
MANSIEFAKNYTGILDEVYQRAAVSRCLNSGGRMVRAGRNAKEILIPKISVTGLGDYTRNVGYKTGSITYEYETHSFGYDRAIRLFADVMDVEESGVLDCFVEAGAELQRTQVVNSHSRLVRRGNPLRSPWGRAMQCGGTRVGWAVPPPSPGAGCGRGPRRCVRLARRGPRGISVD